jgi:hypothetical protein
VHPDAAGKSDKLNCNKPDFRRDKRIDIVYWFAGLRCAFAVLGAFSSLKTFRF